jgi:homoserine kinase
MPRATVPRATNNTVAGFDVFVMNIEGATHTITGLKATTTVTEFVQLVKVKTGIPTEQIKLVRNKN